MSLSPKDMDFVEAKAAAAREIALAFGVPPMLLGIPGDNTLCQLRRGQPRLLPPDRHPAGASAPPRRSCNGSQPAYGDRLTLQPDLDAIEALVDRTRKPLAPRLGRGFLSDDEKREAVGYGQGAGGDGCARIRHVIQRRA